MESITHGFRERTRKISFKGDFSRRAGINRKPPSGEWSTCRCGKIHHAEIFTSADRNFASHILLVPPGRCSRFGKQGVSHPCLVLPRCKPLSVRSKPLVSQIV